MQLPAMAVWAWIPMVIFAALAQTARNAAQRTLTQALGTLSATLIRFLYGLPFAALWLLVVISAGESATGSALGLVSSMAAPAMNYKLPYVAWLSLGAVAQIAATAFLLRAMKERNFIVGITFAKTEVLQVAVFAALFLHEVPGWLALLAILLATLGVVLLSIPKTAQADDLNRTGWVSKAALFGLASGACFAIASVGYRGAALAQVGVSPWLIGAWGVVWAQALQTLLLGSYLAWQQRGALRAIAVAWRLSLVAGSMGALASIGWFTAFAITGAAEVKTLGMIEVLFSYLVSRRLFNENLSGKERLGLVLVALGLVAICAQL
jgi:drug/metabolite transporter (DMT)-like permease